MAQSTLLVTLLSLFHFICTNDAIGNRTNQLLEPSLELMSDGTSNTNRSEIAPATSTDGTIFGRLLMRRRDEANWTTASALTSSASSVPSVHKSSRGNLTREYLTRLTNGAIAASFNYQRQLTKLEKAIELSGVGLSSRQEDYYFRYFSYEDKNQKQGRDALALLEGTRYLTIQTKPSFEDVIDFEIAEILQIDLRSSPLAGFCKAKVECKKAKKLAGTEYRNADGSCNNRLMPHWGMAGGSFYREIPSQPYYDDFVNAPRTISVDRVSKLPSARKVSAQVSPDERTTSDFTVLLMQFGQWVSHDFTEIQVPLPLQNQVPASQGEKDSGIAFDCCTSSYPQFSSSPSSSASALASSLLSPFKHHPECYPIKVDEDDPFYSKFGVTCLNFLRALPILPDSCSFPIAREQINGQTGYLDLSHVYGNSDDKMASLRSFDSGLLSERSLHKHYKVYPPRDKNYSECSIPAHSKYACFKTGDDRGNMHLWLTTFQIIFFRYHNLIARQLKEINYDWSDERLFQETRRLLIAVYQHITYNEHLPLILGPDVMEALHLSPRTSGYSHGYNVLVEGSASITASVSSYRLHNLIPSRVSLIKSNSNHSRASASSTRSNKGPASLELSSTYFDPRTLDKEASAFDQVLNGMTNMPMSKFDRFLTTEVNGKLFRPPGVQYGFDLGAVDIQRGRDVGLSGYNSWVNYCGFEKFHNIQDMSREFSRDFVNVMKSLYKNVDDVDFWAAGIAEKAVPGGVIGKTFACISGLHFARLKFGDRFWYENAMPDVAFTGSKLIHLLK